MRTMPAVAALSLLSMLAACDGSGPTKAEYVNRAGDLCADVFDDARATLDEVPVPSFVDQDFSEEIAAGFHALYKELHDAYRRIDEGLAQLAPPSGDEEEIASLEGSAEEAAATARRWLDAYEAEDFETVDSLANEEIGLEFQRRARAYGIPECSLEGQG